MAVADHVAVRVPKAHRCQDSFLDRGGGKPEPDRQADRRGGNRSSTEAALDRRLGRWPRERAPRLVPAPIFVKQFRKINRMTLSPLPGVQQGEGVLYAPLEHLVGELPVGERS